MADERLLNVSARIRQRRAQYCVVLAGPGQYLGLIGLKEVSSLSNPGNRILADLMDQTPPHFIGHDTPAAEVADIFEREGLQEAIVVSAEKTYLGVVTFERLFAWARAEPRAAQACKSDDSGG